MATPGCRVTRSPTGANAVAEEGEYPEGDYGTAGTADAERSARPAGTGESPDGDAAGGQRSGPEDRPRKAARSRRDAGRRPAPAWFAQGETLPPGTRGKG